MTPLPNTELGVRLERNENEPFRDYLDRIAAETLYAGHWKGLSWPEVASAIVDVTLRLVDANA